MQQNDKSLAERASKGDGEAFGRLYDVYIKKIYNFVYYKTHHRETAEDLTGRIFMKALENISSFSQEKGSFSSWLYKIARNTVIDHYRAAKFDTNIEDAWDISSDSDMACDTDTRLKIEDIRKFLCLLRPIERDVVIMRVWQEMSHKEISEVIGKSEDNCKVIFSRAVVSIRKQMPLAALVALLINIFNS